VAGCAATVKVNGNDPRAARATVEMFGVGAPHLAGRTVADSWCRSENRTGTKQEPGWGLCAGAIEIGTITTKIFVDRTSPSAKSGLVWFQI
jgi:hypothetical protein